MKTKINYQIELEKEIKLFSNSGFRPSILLHACCAPCSSYTIEFLQVHFNITVYFYNPNIFPEKEYVRRRDELIGFIKEFKTEHEIKLILEDYLSDDFVCCAKGFENAQEGGERCFNCFELRLSKTAQKAQDLKFDYFTTTLTISPHKNSDKINEIGELLSKSHNLKFLHSDLKKNNGFKRSLELSEEYGLYRQKYCGCEFSINNKEFGIG